MSSADKNKKSTLSHKELKDALTDLEFIDQLSALMGERGIGELRLAHDDIEIELVREGQYTQLASQHVSMPVAQAPAPIAAPAPAPAASSGGSSGGTPAGAMPSPMVGTVYLAPKPGDPNFVELGAQVSEGQTLMIIEAMKVMNQIAAPKSGKLTQFLVEDGEPVEFGQPLLVIE